MEIHEPLTQAQLHTLTAHEQPPALESGPETDVNGVRRRIPRAERLRVRLSRGLNGEGAQVPKPTAREYEEAQREHR
jgi:ubiquinol-cytochrome c reductase cytochrome b subunit